MPTITRGWRLTLVSAALLPVFLAGLVWGFVQLAFWHGQGTAHRWSES